MVIVFFIEILGIVIVSAVVAIVHDFIVDDWEIRNLTATGIPTTASGHGARILQSVTVSFDVEYKAWFFGRLFGPMPNVNYVIELRLSPNIVECDQTVPQRCPVNNGAINSRFRHVEGNFVIQWDAVGMHEVPVNVRFGGKQLTNTGDPQTDLKVQMTITP